MRLKTLLDGADCEPVCGTLDKDVKALSYHSDKAGPGAAFFAIRGEKNDGHKYIKELAERGVDIFIVEEMTKDCIALQGGATTFIKTDDARKSLAIASRNYFGEPDKQLLTIGITGTKGKTGTSVLLKEILEKAKIPTGIIGTVQQGYVGNYEEAENTTPQSYEIFRLMRKMADGGCKAVVMEVSSQALMQRRTEGIRFDIGIFTNLSPDHIGEGEHKSFEEYAYWKSRLFQQTKTAVVNGDSPYCEKILAESKAKKTIKFSLKQAENIQLYSGNGRLGSVFTFGGEEIRLGLPGRFNLYNAIAAMTAAQMLGISTGEMKNALETVSVRGRTEIIPTGKDFTVMLDYAHNGAAMENLLTALREYQPGRLITVFGCGGSRDPHRRTEMGLAAGKAADLSIITSDNPREEEPDAIIADIVCALSETGGAYKVIPDRAEAIKWTLQNAQHGDMIAVCGKGHETYQLIGREKRHFDDREVIKAVLSNMDQDTDNLGETK